MKWIIQGLFVLSLSGVTGCVTLPSKQYPVKKYYAFEVIRRGPPQRPVPGIKLQIRTLRISDSFRQGGFIYRRGNTRFETDYYNEFFKSPHYLLTDQVRRWISKAFISKHVIPAESQATPSHILEGQIVALYGDYRNPTQPKAHVEVQFFLLDDTGVHSRVMLQKKYTQNILFSGQTEALTQAWNKGLSGIFKALEMDLVKALVAQKNNDKRARTIRSQ